MASIPEILEYLIAGQYLPPGISARAFETPRGADLILELQSANRTYKFLCEVKTTGYPKVFQTAVERASWLKAATNTDLLVIVPYLSNERMEHLALNDLSGIDLCGNAVIKSGELYIWCEGKPNRFKDFRRIRKVYASASSQVGRIFLSLRAFPNLNAIQDSIGRAGGSLSTSAISKVTTEMAQDLVIDKGKTTLALTQPEKLLQLLSDAYTPPTVATRMRFKYTGSAAEITRAFSKAGAAIMLTGASSAPAYAPVPTEPIVSAYVSSIPENVTNALLELGADFKSRFPNFELLQTDDKLPFFECRWNANNQDFLVASETQTFLELDQGDKRSKETASFIARAIIPSLSL